MPNLYESALAFEQDLSRQCWPEPDKLVSQNSKTGQSFRSLLQFCTHRTRLCEEHCYACKGPISWKPPVAKAIAVRRWIEKHGVEESAQRMATEIHWHSIFRWMDRGDFDPLTIQIANRLVEIRDDVAYAAFSRNLEALQSLSPKITRIYSIDPTSAHTAKAVPPDIKVAFMKADDAPMPARVNVVFPLNHRTCIKGDQRDCSFFRNNLVKCASCRRCFG